MGEDGEKRVDMGLGGEVESGSHVTSWRWEIKYLVKIPNFLYRIRGILTKDTINQHQAMLC